MLRHPNAEQRVDDLRRRELRGPGKNGNEGCDSTHSPRRSYLPHGDQPFGLGPFGSRARNPVALQG